jgi:MFS family permease
VPVARYLRILRNRAALVPFVAAVVARLPIAMGPLGMVLLVQSVRGTYSIAGIVSAAFAVGAAVGAPIWGGLMDRRGQPIVILQTSVLSAGLLAALAVGAVLGAAAPVLIGLAAGVGLAFPPISSAMRGAWRVVLDADVDRRAAFALDAVAIETIFVGGPLLLSGLLVITTPVVPLLVTAVLLAAGGVGYAVTDAARRWRPDSAGRRTGGMGPTSSTGRGSDSPLRVPAVLIALLVATATAVGFGLNDVSLAATAREVLGSQARVGLLFAAIAGGSAIGGLWYGSRVWRRPEDLRLPPALAGFAAGLFAVAGLLRTDLGGSLWLLLPLLFGAGLSIAPSLIILANLVDHHGPPGRLGEAQAWLNTAFTSGGALGTGAAGVAVDAGGPARGFLVAAGAVGVALLVAAVAAVRRAPDRRSSRPVGRA